VKLLEQVLADIRGDAAVLRRSGHDRDAVLREQLAGEVAEAAHEYLTWLSEGEAMLRSGRSKAWLRGQFPEWERGGHGRKGPRSERTYRMLIVPRRAAVGAAYQAGRKAARDVAA
jgi:hypothetical protein